MSAENKKSHDDDTMDFNKLEKELAMAVEQDQRYWRENDAKFRAVHQKVGSYEEFRYEHDKHTICFKLDLQFSN